MSEIPAVDLSVLDELYRHMAGRVRYHLAAKAPALDADSHAIKQIDCSGWVRYALARATGGALVLPDGSWYQREWCQEHLRRLREYADVKYAASDPSRLFVAFIAPGAEGPGAAGHVWLVRAGMTYESHGGKGVDSRRWNYATLAHYASAAYELPAKA